MLDWLIAYLNSTDGLLTMSWLLITCNDCKHERKYSTIVERIDRLERRIENLERCK